MTETELKFWVDPERAAAVEAALRRAGAGVTAIESHYFDTADERLADAGLALRLRLVDGRWEQTPKASPRRPLPRGRHQRVKLFRHACDIGGHPMDEYTMTWSDAARIESAYCHFEGWFGPAGSEPGYGTLGRALWRERCLAGVLALEPEVRSDEARKLVASLSRHPRWLLVDPGEAASKIHSFAAM